MTTNTEEYVYAAVDPSKPGYCAIALTNERAADDVAEWIRIGLEVHRVSIAEGMRGLAEYIESRGK